MRTTDTSALTFNAFRPAGRRGSWTMRLVLAALLIAAAAAFALLPNSAGAQQTLGPADYCKSNAETNGIIPAANFNTDLQADCLNLLAAAKLLNEPSGENDLNWISNTPDTLENITALITNWEGVSVGPGGCENNTPIDCRVNTVILTLPAYDLSGTLAAEWSNLSALTNLDLSGNAATGSGATATKGINGSLPDGWATGFDSLTILNLSGNSLDGTAPYAVMKHLTATPATGAKGPSLLAATNLNLSNNPKLQPSPPMDLEAEVIKEDDGETTFNLDWRHTGWYTINEDTSATDNNNTQTHHSYEYCLKADCTTAPWSTVPVSDIDYTRGGNLITSTSTPTTPTTKGDRATFTISNITAANTHVIQVRAVKTTYTDEKRSCDS